MATNSKDVFLEFPKESTVIFVQEETDAPCTSTLKQIATKNKAVMLSIIAPNIGKKISPVDVARAAIGLREEIGVEIAIEKMKEVIRDLKEVDLYLLLETPGGNVDSSYKIARFLAKTFKSIYVFVVHRASSGGTLISFSAKKIKMGDMASLSPIDIQTPYQGLYVSVNKAASSLTSISKFFKTQQVEQIEYPYTALANKLDPIIYEDWTSKQWSMVDYALDILRLSHPASSKNIEVIKNFVLTDKPHNFVIQKELAEIYGLEIAGDNELQDELNCMRWWLKEHMFKEGASHIIRYVLPDLKSAASVGQRPTKAAKATKVDLKVEK